MYYFDNFYPENDQVVNLSDVSTLEAFARASVCDRVKITLDHIPESREVVIPIRIVDGMTRILDRGTVSEKQFVLLWSLFDLLMKKAVTL
jgi:hypothetical protein